MSGPRPRRACRGPAPSTHDDGGTEVVGRLATAMCDKKVVIVSGAGLSADAGLASFTSTDGIYEKARRDLGVRCGKDVFSYRTYAKSVDSRRAANRFFASLHAQMTSRKVAPGAGHIGIARLDAAGGLLRHYTLNIDGVHRRAGQRVVEPSDVPEDGDLDGGVVEMHGYIGQAICEASTAPHRPSHVTSTMLRHFRNGERALCPHTGNPLRFRFLLYDDPDEGIVAPQVMAWLAEDVRRADVVVWLGISFSQSASVGYLRTCRSAGGTNVRHIIVNVDPDAYGNVVTALADVDGIEFIEADAKVFAEACSAAVSQSEKKGTSMEIHT